MEIELHEIDRKFEMLRVFERGRLSRLTSSLAQRGQLSPVMVIESEPGAYVLIDGYARVRALELLDRDVVSAIVLTLSERDALLEHFRRETSRRRSALEEGWLLRELRDGLGLKLGELAIRVDKSTSWVSRRLSLVELLSGHIQDAVRNGQIPPHAAAKYLVPLARANATQADRLVEQLGDDGASVRELERLYQAWRRGDDAHRERIVEHPQLFLRAEEAITKPALEATFDCDPAVLHELRFIACYVHRVSSRLEAGELDEADPGVVGDFERRWRSVQHAFERLMRVMSTKQSQGQDDDRCGQT